MYNHGMMEYIDQYSTSSPDPTDKSQPLDSWSVIWYIASFGGLIAFFLVVSCSEWCCRRSARQQNACRHHQNSTSTTVPVPDTPPPSYDHFAPPSYESLIYNKRGEKSEFDVYVVPVHAFGAIVDTKATHMDAPPSYTSANCNPDFHPACLPMGLGCTVQPIVQNDLLGRTSRPPTVLPSFETSELPAGTNCLPAETEYLRSGTNDLPVGVSHQRDGMSELQFRADDLRAPSSTVLPQGQSHVVT